MDNIPERIQALRKYVEEDLGGPSLCSKVLDGLVEELKKDGPLYPIPTLRAMVYKSTNKELKEEIKNIIADLKKESKHGTQSKINQ